jgi:hypothetical protein
LKFDASAVSGTPDKDTKVYATPTPSPDEPPKLKFDTRAIKPKEEEPTQSKRPGLKFDTSALSKQPPPTQLKPSLDLPKKDEGADDEPEE